jgi:TPP-dependent pyruvate/acetoin dehydrogenase alpha subunit
VQQRADEDNSRPWQAIEAQRREAPRAIVLVSAAMQAAPDRPTETKPPVLGQIVRALREDGVDASFRAVLDVGPAVHRHMVRARVVSARMVALQRSGRIGFHTSSIGAEAVIVGTALAARDGDWIFPSARDWYAALARGMPLETYVHHAFGSARDPAKGHASPDHAPARRFLVVPPSGVAGAHVPQAVGAAWAAKIKKDATCTVALFGDEVTDTGDFHNGMNFAGVFKAPAVFVCRSRPSANVADRAVAYGLASARVDGTDALAVLTVVRAALARAAEGKGATLIEAVCEPLPGAAKLDDGALASDDVLDLGDGDGLVRLRRALVREGVVEAGAAQSIAAAVRAELDAAIAAAEQAGPPMPESIFEDVYAGTPAHLAAQRRNMEAERRG